MVLKAKEEAKKVPVKKAKKDMTEEEKKQAAAEKKKILDEVGLKFIKKVVNDAENNIKPRYYEYLKALSESRRKNAPYTAFLVTFPFKACFKVDSKNNNKITIYKDFDHRVGYVYSIFQAIAESYTDEYGWNYKLKDEIKDVLNQKMKDLKTDYGLDLEWDFFQTKTEWVISVNWHSPEVRAHFKKMKEDNRREYAKTRRQADIREADPEEVHADVPEETTPEDEAEPEEDEEYTKVKTKSSKKEKKDKKKTYTDAVKSA